MICVFFNLCYVDILVSVYFPDMYNVNIFIMVEFVDYI